MEKIAIEWLEEIIYYKEDFNLAEVFKQAKVKEREQIIDAFDTAKYLSSSKNYNGEKYYKKTFKQD